MTDYDVLDEACEVVERLEPVARHLPDVQWDEVVWWAVVIVACVALVTVAVWPRG